MDKLQVRYTPDEAALIARWLERGAIDAESAQECRELAEQAARLNHLAARARNRATTDTAA